VNIFVGNLSRETAEADLRQAFEAFGQVTRATIVIDKMTSQSKGFGFVEMSTKEEGEAAISGMANKELHGRTLNVSEARPRNDAPRSSGGGGSRGGYGGGGGRSGGGGYGGGGGRR
jgi:cold-inducible RNA-binding protein